MKIDPELQQLFDQYQELRKPSLVDHLGIEFVELSKDKLIATMPVDQRTHQPFGILHGGASVALAETLASFGAFLNVAARGKSAVGLEINANHVRPVRDGRVLGTGIPVHRGATTQIWQVDIRTPEGKLVCTSRCTMAIVDRV